LKVNGECHCGYISYRAEVDPERVLICHCTDGQTLSGSAYRTVAPAVDGTFELISGELKTYIKTAENGALRSQTFCPECGSPIYAGPADENSTMLGLRVGTLAQRDQLPPRSQYYSNSAQNWVQDISALKSD
jgi:hypothetical protein